MSLLDEFPHRCTIRKRTRVKDTVGGHRVTSTAISTGVVCWEQPATHREVREFEKDGMSINRKIYFTSDPGVSEGYEILITSRDRGVTTISSPIVLEVRSESGPDATAGLGKAYKVMAEDLTNEGP